ncbi:MAG: hypothetical protein ACFCGT_25235 [Sandaracinaceae bacterium]
MLLVREGSGGGSEVFMVRRSAASRFLGGAYVFPGGKVDPDDCDAPWDGRVLGPGPVEAARALGEAEPARARGLFIAALRETFEEAGVLLADRPVERSRLAALREALAAEATPFRRLLEGASLRLRLADLTPFARWVTPRAEKRRYDARFFLARSPAEQAAAHDEVEVTAGAWLAPKRALERGQAGEILLAPPTHRILEQLAAAGTVDAAFAEARRQGPPPRIEPRFCLDDDGGWFLALPGDPLHEEPERLVPGPTRFRIVDGRFVTYDPPEPG